MKLLAHFLVIAGFTAMSSIAQSWNSRLFPNVNGKYTEQQVSFAGRSWALEDFSYAGYYLGTKSLGSVPCNVVQVTATGDITQAVRAPGDTGGKSGGRVPGSPPGSYPLPGPAAIPSHTVSVE